MHTSPLMLTAVFGLGLITACTEKEKPATPELTEALKAEMIDQGTKASAALFGELSSKLQAAMKSGGPTKAITVCKEVAQTTTLKTSNTFADLKLTRVALKTRNPKNRADDLDRSVLQEWKKQLESGQPLPKPIVKLKDAHTAVYYKPIPVGSICLKCHGAPSTFPEELTRQLKQLYPDDQAIGYKANDLRGAFRVEFPLQDQE